MFFAREKLLKKSFSRALFSKAFNIIIIITAIRCGLFYLSQSRAIRESPLQWVI